MTEGEVMQTTRSRFAGEGEYPSTPPGVSAGRALENIKLKIPVARLGTNVHKSYGLINFSQLDFDQMVTNFNSNELGFVPYLRYGHARFPKAIDGEPSTARLVSLQQEGPVLFGIFQPDNMEVVQDIEKGNYRYASGEFTRNDRSKRTGIPIGTVLSAVALTNAPFLPDLPEAQILSNSVDNSDFYVLELYQELSNSNEYLSNEIELVEAFSTLLSEFTEENKDMMSGTMNQMMTKEKEKEEMSSGIPDAPRDVTEHVVTPITANAKPEDRSVVLTKDFMNNAEPRADVAAIKEELSAMKNKVDQMCSSMETLSTNIESLSSGVAMLKKEKEELSQQVVATASVVQEFSQSRKEMALSNKAAELLASGIPAKLVDEWHKVAVTDKGETAVKLSNGNDGTYSDFLIQWMEALPAQQRVPAGQVGQNLSANANAPAVNPFFASGVVNNFKGVK
jgi:hypothetical protein